MHILAACAQAISCAAAYESEWPLLIVCPSSARYHWEHELLKWLDEDSITKKQITVVCKSKQGLNRDVTKVVIMSYELVSPPQFTSWHLQPFPTSRDWDAALKSIIQSGFTTCLDLFSNIGIVIHRIFGGKFLYVCEVVAFYHDIRSSSPILSEIGEPQDQRYRLCGQAVIYIFVNTFDDIFLPQIGI